MTTSSRAQPVSTRLLREHVKALFARLPGAVFGEATAVHQLRVAGRRLRLALGLLAKRPRGARVRRARGGLRELIRAAALGRDLDVMLALLERQLEAEPRPRVLQRRLLRGLRQAQRRSRQQLGEALLDLDLARLRRGLRELLARGGGVVAECVARVRAAAEQRRAGLAALLAESPGAFEAERLHAVRIGFRWLRYTAELWEALSGQQGEETALLRAQQQQLGQVHDAWILSCWLRARAERAVARGQHELAAAASRLADQIEVLAREAHAAWLRSHPRELLEGLRVAWREAAEPPQPTED